MASASRAAPPPAIAPSPRREYRALLVAFYTDVAPDKVAKVDTALDKYKGREEALLQFLENKYARQGHFVGLETDPRSPLFNAAVTLAAPRSAVKMPVPNAPPLDNLRKCRVLLPKSSEHYIDPVDRSAAIEQRRAADAAKAAAAAAARAERPQTVLDELADMFAEGPLSLLRRLYKTRARVRVAIRRIDGVRGHLCGYLKAFDRHMNMVLIDVDETFEVVRWQAPRRGGGGGGGGGGGDRPRRVVEARKRHMNQLLVRGDCVVLVHEDTLAASMAVPAKLRRILDS